MSCRWVDAIISSEWTGKVAGSVVGGVTAVVNIFNNSVLDSIGELVSTFVFALFGGIAGWLGAHFIKYIWKKFFYKCK